MALNLKKLYITAEYGDNHRFIYNAGADELSAVKTSGYFNEAVKERVMQTGDIMDVIADNNGSGATVLITVTGGVVSVVQFAGGNVSDVSGDISALKTAVGMPYSAETSLTARVSALESTGG